MNVDKITIDKQKSRELFGVIGTGASVMRALGGDRRAAIKTPIVAPPTLSGPHGRAWLCDLAQQRRELNMKAEGDARLAHWIVEAPWAHPFWHSYSITLIHLRPMPDGQKAVFHLACATHEICLHALDPDADRNEMLQSAKHLARNWLKPVNFAAQFIEVRDDLAQDRLKRAVQQICDGNLSPDTDCIRAWAALFCDNMMKDRPNARSSKDRRG